LPVIFAGVALPPARGPTPLVSLAVRQGLTYGISFFTSIQPAILHELNGGENDFLKVLFPIFQPTNFYELKDRKEEVLRDFNPRKDRYHYYEPPPFPFTVRIPGGLSRSPRETRILSWFSERSRALGKDPSTTPPPG